MSKSKRQQREDEALDAILFKTEPPPPEIPEENTGSLSNLIRQTDEQKARCKKLAAVTNQHSNTAGYVPFAYALVPDGKGSYCAVELRQVTFFDCRPADPTGPFNELEVEPRTEAHRHVEAGLRRRTMCEHHAGWDTAKTLKDKGLVETHDRRVPVHSGAARAWRESKGQR